MKSLNYAEQIALALSIFGVVFSVLALAFTWWISRPEPMSHDDAHNTAAE
jgi:hypothetical protein